MYLVARLSNSYLTSIQRHIIKTLETLYLSLGQYLLNYLPHSRERALSIAKLNESLMWARQSLLLDSHVPLDTQETDTKH